VQDPLERLHPWSPVRRRRKARRQEQRLVEDSTPCRRAGSTKGVARQSEGGCRRWRRSGRANPRPHGPASRPGRSPYRACECAGRAENATWAPCGDRRRSGERRSSRWAVGEPSSRDHRRPRARRLSLSTTGS
jgi:hypothetical protein